MKTDIAFRRKQIQQELDANAVRIGELTGRNRELQNEYRALEREERLARDALKR